MAKSTRVQWCNSALEQWLYCSSFLSLFSFKRISALELIMSFFNNWHIQQPSSQQWPVAILFHWSARDFFTSGPFSRHLILCHTWYKISISCTRTVCPLCVLCVSHQSHSPLATSDASLFTWCRVDFSIRARSLAPVTHWSMARAVSVQFTLSLLSQRTRWNDWVPHEYN